MAIARTKVTRPLLAGILFLLGTTAARAACPEGTIQVGERRVQQGNVIVVHPVCRRVAQPAPAAPAGPIQMSAIEDAVDFRVTGGDGRALTSAQATGLPLVNGASLSTGPHGRARLSFPDGTILTLGANTRFVVEVRPGPDGARLSLAGGVARWVRSHTEVALRRLNRRFGIRMAAVVVAVRGTDFEMSLDAAGNGFLRLREGVIDYRGAEDEPARELRAGQVLRLVRGRLAGVE